MVILYLILLGLCFGSFVNALVWRLHIKEKTKAKKQKAGYSLMRGRSMCVHCKQTLGVKDLIPIISWLILRGKCRYCKKPISWQYPVVEAATAFLFAASFIYWPMELSGWAIIHFAGWLVCLVGFMALIVYDLRWMILPNKIIFPLYGVAAVATLAQMLHAGSSQPLLNAVYGVLVGGGIFYILFQLSNGRWIGGGDVKLGFLLGVLVGGFSQAILLLFVASLLGSIVSILMILSKRATRRTRIPFGPFLIIAAILVQLFGSYMTDWYFNQFLYPSGL